MLPAPTPPITPHDAAAPFGDVDPDVFRRLTEFQAWGYPGIYALRKRCRSGDLPAMWCGNHWKARLRDVAALYPLRNGRSEQASGGAIA